MIRIADKIRVVLLTKAPQPGRVKTRLVASLGAEGAAALQARLVKHVLATVTAAGFRNVELHGDPASDRFLQFCAAQYRVPLIEQCAGDLGARMHHAFAGASGDIPTLLIGSDCPALTARHLRAAARLLTTSHDAVLIPAEDGGYVLIGLARSDVRVFEQIAWGTPSVLEQTRDRLRSLGRRWAELATLWDVDDPADYERLMRSGFLDKHSRARTRRGSVVPESF
jgi:uncharacterized protein